MVIIFVLQGLKAVKLHWKHFLKSRIMNTALYLAVFKGVFIIVCSMSLGKFAVGSLARLLYMATFQNINLIGQSVLIYVYHPIELSAAL